MKLKSILSVWVLLSAAWLVLILLSFTEYDGAFSAIALLVVIMIAGAFFSPIGVGPEDLITPVIILAGIFLLLPCAIMFWSWRSNNSNLFLLGGVWVINVVGLGGLAVASAGALGRILS